MKKLWCLLFHQKYQEKYEQTIWSDSSMGEKIEVIHYYCTKCFHDHWITY